MTERRMDLLRHGAVEGEVYLRGEWDDPLTPLGWEQMRRATAEGRTWTRILSSPSRRCAAFAEELATDLGLPLEQRTVFRERSFGGWEGLAVHEIPRDELEAFWTDPIGYTPPDAEPFAAFRARVLEGWSQLLGEPDPHALLVTHGGVMRILISQVLGMSEDGFLQLEVPHACRTQLRIPDPPWRPSLIAHCPL